MLLLRIFVSVTFFVLLLTAYSFFKAWAVVKLGDPTPSYRGRLSLNPMDHFEPMGFIILIAVAMLSGGSFIFGWPKPIEYNPHYFRNPKRDEIIVCLAGPLGVLLLAWISLKLGTLVGGSIGMALYWFSYVAVWLFIWLMLPIRPMEGERVIRLLLSDRLAYQWDSFQDRYNLWLFLGLILILSFFPLPFQLLHRTIMGLLSLV